MGGSGWRRFLDTFDPSTGNKAGSCEGYPQDLMRRSKPRGAAIFQLAVTISSHPRPLSVRLSQAGAETLAPVRSSRDNGQR